MCLQFYKCILFTTVAFVFSIGVFAQFDNTPQRLRISLLTASPGEELYSIFGHSALRIIDSNAVTDLVYNYGTFNFDDPNFYSKFVKGKLNYYLNIERFDDFIFQYNIEGRDITEQVLHLSDEEKQLLRTSINENAKDENKYYLYDFFLDNCTTRLRDLIEKIKKTELGLPPAMPTKYSFRDAIHKYLDSGDKAWSKLGIDLLLAKPTDAIMTERQQLFLPDNLMYAIDNLNKSNIVLEKIKLNSVNIAKSEKSWFGPTVFFLMLLLCFILLDLVSKKILWLTKLLTFGDWLLFFSTGSLGILLIFMWFFTDHSMTKYNYNLLYLFPANIVFAFFVGSKKKWVSKYFYFISISMLLVLLLWQFLPQALNISLLPFVLLLMYRSLSLGRKIRGLNS